MIHRCLGPRDLGDWTFGFGVWLPGFGVGLGVQGLGFWPILGSLQALRPLL